MKRLGTFRFRLPIWCVLGFVLALVEGLAQQSFRPVAAAHSHQLPTRKPLGEMLGRFQATERSASEIKWEKRIVESLPNGEEASYVQSYIELGAGLNYWDESLREWVESRELIEPVEGGAIARKGVQQVKFATNLDARGGAIEILNGDGVRLKASIIGIVFRNRASGDSVTVAELKNSEGVLIPPNRLVYKDAFSGLKADVQYIYRRTGLAQEVIILGDLPSPEAIAGFPSSDTILEVVTEFFEAPSPKRSVKNQPWNVRSMELLGSETGKRFADEQLDFGLMKIGDGIGFATDLGPTDFDELVSVEKKWRNVNGRKLLFEGVDYTVVSQHLARLGLDVPSGRNDSGKPIANGVGNRRLPLPSFVGRSLTPVRREAEPYSPPLGFLIDYTTFGHGSVTNYVFKSGATYHVGAHDFYGTTIFEGMSVVKIGHRGQLILKGPAIFNDSELRPTIFTVPDDDSVGESIQFSTGNPSRVNLTRGLGFDGSSGVEVKNCRFSYIGFPIENMTPFTIVTKNCQFFDTYQVFWSTDSASKIVIENALVSSAYRFTYTADFDATNLTMEDVTYQGGLTLDPSKMTFRNSLLINIGEILPYTGQGQSHNVELSSSAGLFQSAAGGGYYLANGSPYRDSGTSSISSDLAERLGRMTTKVPTVFTNDYVLPVDTVWDAGLTMDNDGAFDIGYHYPRVDYVIENLEIGPFVPSGSGNPVARSLTVNPGVVIGVGKGGGILLHDLSDVNFSGEAHKPITMMPISFLQESSFGPGGVSKRFSSLCQSEVSTQNSLRLKNSILIGDGNSSSSYCLVVSSGTSSIETKEFVSSEFHDGRFYIFDYEPTRSLVLSNCLLNLSYFDVYGSLSVDSSHNVFEDANIVLIPFGGQWRFQDNILYSNPNITTLNGLTAVWTLGYNAFINTTGRFEGGTQLSDIVLPSLSFSSGPFGDYYQVSASSLKNAGSQGAAAAGLYHYTTTWPGDVKEGASTVNIGIHYPSTIPGLGGN